MTAIHPVNATVERVTRKEPQEPEACVWYTRSGNNWWSTTPTTLAAAQEEARGQVELMPPGGRVLLVRIGAAPSPASAEIDQLLVDLYNKITFMDGDPVERNAVLRSFDALSEKLRRVTR